MLSSKIIICLFYIYILYNTYTFSEKIDTIVEDCYNLRGKEVCGICGHTSIGTPQKCIYPFVHRFEVNDGTNGKCKPDFTSGSCKPITTYCTDNICKNGGTCHEGFSTFRCRCPDTHYGMTCEFIKERFKKYAEGIQVFVHHQVKFATNTSLVITTDVQGSDLLFKMESDLFQLNYADTPVSLPHPNERVNYCKRRTGLGDSECAFIRDASKDVYTMMFIYPAIDSVLGPFIFKGKAKHPVLENQIGYVDNLTITAYQTKRLSNEKLTYVDRDYKPVFNKTYNLFIYYNNQALCMHILYLQNNPLGDLCTTSPRKRPVYPPRKGFQIAFDYSYLQGPIDNWLTKYINTNFRYVMATKRFIGREVYPKNYEHNSKALTYLTPSTEGEIIRERKYGPQPFDLETGIFSYDYITWVNLTYFGNHAVLGGADKYSGEKPPNLNFIRCFFEIRREMLVPIINDGINQTIIVSTVDGVIIDARKSTNLNRKDKQRLMKWSCKFGTTSVPCFSKRMFDDTADYFTFSENVLKSNKTYNFTLKLYEEKYKLTTAYAFIALDVRESLIIIIRLSCPKCWTGLIANPIDYNILVLKHVGMRVNPSDFNYIWKYREFGETEFKSADDLRVGLSETDNTVFKIGKHKLKYAKSYEFNVSIENEPEVHSTLLIQTPQKHIKSCSVEPNKGIAAETLFNIKCVVVPEQGVTYVYEFFDKNVNEEDYYRGRMIGNSINGELYKFRLTRGIVSVVSFDSLQVHEEFNVTVALSSFEGNGSDVDVLLEYLEPGATFEAIEVFHLKSPQRDIALASVIAEILTTEMNKNHVIENLMRPLLDSDISLSHVKMCISSIRNILVAMFENLDEFELRADIAKQCSQIILKTTTVLVHRSANMDDEQTLTETICQQIAIYVLDTVSLIAGYKNKEMLSNIEEFVNPVVLDLVQQTSNELVDSLGQINHMLLKLQIPGDTPLRLHSLKNQITAWVKVTFPEVMHKITLSEQAFPLRISIELAAFMKKDSYIGVQFILMTVNPFWWAGGDIVTQVLMVIFGHKNDWFNYKKVHRLRYPVKLLYNITKAVNEMVAIDGDLIGYSNNMSFLEKDLSLLVYRFHPPLRAKLFIQFLFDENQDGYQYSVYFKESLRPDSDDMSAEGVLISSENPFYNISYQKTDRDIIYYMGILPVVGNYDRGTTFPFKLNIYYTKCNTWIKWHWSDHGCWVGEGTSDTTLECDCTHLSLFAGTVAVPSNNRVDFLDFKLFLTPQTKLLPLIIMLIILIVYVMCLIWSILRDKKDKTKIHVIILEDNYPGDRYGYLVAVYTGARLKSGTNANVGIKLLGSKSESRPHILKSSTRQTLMDNSEDWFLIYCPNYLGHLACLHVWHDNSSKGPDWFLDKIKVFDLKRNIQYIFYVYEWINFDLNSLPEALFNPAKLKNVLSEKRAFVDNMAIGLRDSHYWTSVLRRHPRDPVTRVQRLHVVLCFIMTSMAFSLLLYLVQYTFPSEEDEPSFELTSFDIWALLLSLIAALTVTCLIMYLFKRSFHFKTDWVPSSIFIRKDIDNNSFDEATRDSNKKKPSKKHYYILPTIHVSHDFIEYRAGNDNTDSLNSGKRVPVIYGLLRGSPLAPVHLDSSSDGISIRKSQLVISWVVCCTVIMVCVGIVVIFGWKIEPVHGDEWATIFFLSLIIDLFIISVLKIIIISTILSVMFSNMIPIDRYCINKNSLLQAIADASALEKILEVRAQDMYQPLTHKMKDAILIKINRKARWEIMCHICVIFLFIVVLAFAMTIFTSVLYPSNRHVEIMMSHGHLTSHHNFLDVFNRTDVEDFLQYNFISQLYRFLWYNLQPLVDIKLRPDKLDWTDDCVMRLVGNAYLRQLRVVSGACPKVRHMENVSHLCYPVWSRSQEDKDTYYIGWTSHADESLIKTTAWRYQPPDDTSSSENYGASETLYPAGGYFSHLGHNKRETQHVVSSLIENSWLDRSTRALFLQLTLYNVNTKLFSHVILVTEHMPSGEFIPFYKVDSMAIEFTYSAWNISYIVFLLLFTVRMILIMNKHGILQVLSTHAHQFDLCLIFLGYCTIIVYFLHIQKSSEYVEKYQRKGFSEFFSFTRISRYAFISKWMMCILFFLLVGRLMYSFRFGKIFLRFFFTLYLSFRRLCLLLICLMLYIFILWRFLGYLINVFLFNNHTSICLLPKDVQTFNKLSTAPSSVKLILASMCSLSAITVMIFITLFTHYYKIAQGYKVVDVDTFNFYTFLKDEIKLIKLGKSTK